jgi:hypothetical protein
MQLPTISLLNSSDTEDDEAEVEVFLPSKQFGNTPLDFDAVISAAEGTLGFSLLGTSHAGASVQVQTAAVAKLILGQAARMRQRSASYKACAKPITLSVCHSPAILVFQLQTCAQFCVRHAGNAAQPALAKHEAAQHSPGTSAATDTTYASADQHHWASSSSTNTTINSSNSVFSATTTRSSSIRSSSSATSTNTSSHTDWLAGSSSAAAAAALAQNARHATQQHHTSLTDAAAVSQATAVAATTRSSLAAAAGLSTSGGSQQQHHRQQEKQPPCASTSEQQQQQQQQQDSTTEDTTNAQPSTLQEVMVDSMGSSTRGAAASAQAMLSATAVLADELDLDGLLLRLTAARAGTAAAAAFGSDSSAGDAAAAPARRADGAAAGSSERDGAVTSDYSSSGDAHKAAGQQSGSSERVFSRSASAAVAALAAAVGASVGVGSSFRDGGPDEDVLAGHCHSAYLPRWARRQQQQQQQQLEAAQQGSSSNSSSMGATQAAAAAAGRCEQGRLWVPPPLPTATLDLRHAAAAVGATDAVGHVSADATAADGSRIVLAQLNKAHKAFAGLKGVGAAAAAAAAANSSSGSSSSIKAWRGWQDDSSSSSSSSSDGDESDDSEEDWRAFRQQARSRAQPVLLQQQGQQRQQQRHGSSQQQARDAEYVADVAEITDDDALTQAGVPAATSNAAAAAAAAPVAPARDDAGEQLHANAATQGGTGVSAVAVAAAAVGINEEQRTAAAAVTQGEVEQVMSAPRAASAELSVSIAAVHSRLQALLAPATAAAAAAAAAAATPGQEHASSEGDNSDSEGSDDSDLSAGGHMLQQPDATVVASCGASCAEDAGDGGSGEEAAVAAALAVAAGDEGSGVQPQQHQQQQPDSADAAPLGQDHAAAADSTTDTITAATTSGSVSHLVLSPYLLPEQQAEQHLSMLCISPVDNLGCFTTLAVADLVERVLSLQLQLGLAVVAIQYQQQQVQCHTLRPMPADGKSSSSSSSSSRSQLQISIYWPTEPGVSKFWLPRQQQVQLLQAALQADDLPKCSIDIISGNNGSSKDSTPGSLAANHYHHQQQQLVVSCIREGAFEIRSGSSQLLLPAVLRRAAAVGLTLVAATTFHIPAPPSAAAAGDEATPSEQAAAAAAVQLLPSVLPAHKPLLDSSTVALLLAGSGRDPVGRWAEQIGPSGDLAVVTDAASLHAQFWQQRQQQQQLLISCSHDSSAAAKEAQLLFPELMEHWHNFSSSSSSSVAYSVCSSTAAGAVCETATMTSNGDVTAAVWPVTNPRQLQHAFAALQHLVACGFAVTDLCRAVMLRDGFAAAASTICSSSSSTADVCCGMQGLGGSPAVRRSSSGDNSSSSSMPVLFASLSKAEALSTGPVVLDLWQSSSNSRSSCNTTSGSSSGDGNVNGGEFVACLLPGNAVQLQHLQCLQESCCGIPASFDADELLNAAQQQQQQQQQQLGVLSEPQQQQQHWWRSRSGIAPQHGLQQLVAVAAPANDMEAALAVLQAVLLDSSHSGDCETPCGKSAVTAEEVHSGVQAGVSSAAASQQLPVLQLAAVRLLGRLPVQVQQQEWIQPAAAAAAAAAGGMKQGRVAKGVVLLAVLYGIDAQSRIAAALAAATTATSSKAASSSSISSSSPSSWKAAVQAAAAAASVSATHRAAASALTHCFDQSQFLPTAGPLQDLLLLPPPTTALCAVTAAAASRTAVLQQLLRVLHREGFDVAAAGSSSGVTAELAAALQLPAEVGRQGVLLLQLVRPSAGTWLPHLLHASGEL